MKESNLFLGRGREIEAKGGRCWEWGGGRETASKKRMGEQWHCPGCFFQYVVIISKKT